MSAAPEAEPSSFRLVATLTIAGLVSGLLLVGAYQITKPIIERNEAEALQAAVFQVLPGTEELQPLVLREGHLDPATPADKDAPTIYAGRRRGGALVGYAIPAQGPGFQDTIKLIFGYDPARAVIVGMKVLDSRETPGLGDKIKKDKAFLDNFTALAVDPEIVPVGTGKKAAPNELDCITGATISSKAIAKIVNGGMETWRPVLVPEGLGATEPEPPPVPQEATP
ncbi:MAG: FMN-binding protein [Pseudomonadota bacterium]